MTGIRCLLPRVSTVCPVALLLFVAALLPVAGCSSTEEPELDYPTGQADAGEGAAITERGPRQGSGERAGPSREALPEELATFLRYRVFWTGGAGIRIEAPGQHPGDPIRFIWLNPTDITPPNRYGSDVTLVTDRSPAHYSPRDIAYVADGETTLVTPLGMHVEHLSGGTNHMQIAPQSTFAVDGIRFETTRAWAATVPKQDRRMHHVGYVIFLDNDGDGLKDLTIWYIGPMDSSEADVDDPALIQFTNVTDPAIESGRVPLYPIDILIVRINTPCELTGQEIVNLAHRVNAGVIVPVGQSLANAEDRAKLLDLNALSDVPLWYPPLPPDQTPPTDDDE